MPNKAKNLAAPEGRIKNRINMWIKNSDEYYLANFNIIVGPKLDDNGAVGYDHTKQELAFNECYHISYLVNVNSYSLFSYTKFL